MDNDKKIVQKENWLTILMASISLIPYVGSAINEVMLNRRSRIKQERIGKLVKELEITCAKLDMAKIDKDYLDSEEFGDVLESTFKKTSEFGTSQRIIRFKNLLVNQIKQREDTSIVETYLNLVTTLNEKQLLLLSYYQNQKQYLDKLYKRIKEEEKRGPRGIKYVEKKITLENADKDEISEIHKTFKNDAYQYAGIGKDEDVQFFIQDLVSKSLMTDMSTAMGLDRINELIYTTSYGNKFLKFITEYEE